MNDSHVVWDNELDTKCSLTEMRPVAAFLVVAFDILGWFSCCLLFCTPIGLAQTDPLGAPSISSQLQIRKPKSSEEPIVTQRQRERIDPQRPSQPAVPQVPRIPLIPQGPRVPLIPRNPKNPLFPQFPRGTIIPNTPQPDGKNVPGSDGFLRKPPFEWKPTLPPGKLKSDGEATQLQDVEFAKTGHSFRIATFNTHLLSPIFNKEFFDSRHADKDAHKVANAIAENAMTDHSFDVIVLNEVWDEDAKEILVNTLAPYFPYYIEKMEADAGDTNWAQVGNGTTVQVPIIEDSGLMLFSRLPFVNFRVGKSEALVDRFFKPFEACAGVDAGAAKGIGIVVLENPAIHWHYTVGFTHLQDENESVVDSQMAEIRMKMIEVHALNPELKRGETFLLGDLNIEGCNPSDVNPLQYAPTLPNQQLWKKIFWSPTSYYYKPLYDGWAWTTSAFDMGFTSPGRGGRLDYIIHERIPDRVPRTYAMQHIRHILVGKTNSDHIAVAADLNLPGVASMPRLAFRPESNKSKPAFWWDCMPFAENPIHTTLHGELEYPGSMQWFRFDKKGTYSIGLPVDLIQAGLQVAVYQANDLSMPLAVYNKEFNSVYLGKDPLKEFTLWKYHVGESPLYVCVSNPTDRTWHGGYQLAVHRHRGVNKTDAITLHPGDEPTYPEMPTDQPLNPEDTVWFEFVTDQAHSKLPQKLQMKVNNPSGIPLTLDWLAQDPNNQDKTVKIISTEIVDQPYLQQFDVGGKVFYLNVKRQEYTQSGISVGWNTNLTWLLGLGIPKISWHFDLVCTDETDGDWQGGDEIDFIIHVDGNVNPYSLEHFDGVNTNDHFEYESLIKPVAFLESVEFKISENGEASDDDKDWSQSLVNPIESESYLEKTMPYESKQRVSKLFMKSNEERWPKSMSYQQQLRADLLPGDGNYEFRYNLSHWLNK